ncbi:hypothetical protein [Psychrobacillus vulpis]|uniref:Uncharacterized protein n=1 Tax=Psychrobacillus vulpis TaxID=2325572 RepID=A0A544TW02_9BACI|nr:hypothetical protein [Psychrobacillus vulpis]TQR21630.1 hypothetical protein FG384_01355 [Psychrobacillus vulpis]
MKKRTEIIIYAVVVGSIIIGGLLGIYIIGSEDGTYNFELFLPIVIGALGGFMVFLFLSKWRQKRNGNVPEVDERTITLMKKYFSISLYIVLFGSGALLLVLFAMGVESIETGMLIVYMMIIYFFVGIGAFVTKQL